MIVSRDNYYNYGVYNISGIENACPKGFLIPDNPNDMDNEWINGTACAVACMSPINSDAYYDLQLFLLSAITWVGSVCIVLLALTMLVTQANRQNYIIYATILMSALPTLYTLVITFIPQEQHFCRDNTNAITGEDGFNSCSTQSFINIYSALGLVFVWVLQMWDIFVNVVYGKTEKLVSHRTECCILIYLVPLLPCIVVFASDHQGYNKGNPTCWTNRASGDFDMFASAVISLFLFLPVLRNVLLLLSVNVYYPEVAYTGTHSSTADISLRMPSQYMVGTIASNGNTGTLPMSQRMGVGVGVGVGPGDTMESAVNGEGEGLGDGSSHQMGEMDRNCLSNDDADAGLGLETCASVDTVTTASSEPSVLVLVSTLFQLIVRGSARISPEYSQTTSGSDSGPTLHTGAERDDATGDSGSERESQVHSIIAKNRLLSYSLNLKKRLSVLRGTLLFVAAFLICAFGLWIGRLVVFFNSHKSFDYFDDWIECIFNHYFDGYSDAIAQGSVVGLYSDLERRDSYAREVCGDQPQHVTYWVLGVWFFFAAFGNSWFVSAAYLKCDEVSRLFFSCIIAVCTCNVTPGI